MMRDWCDEAGLPNCSSHGLRKAIARRMAEAGCTAHEIMAVTGHATLAEVTRYTKDANRPKLARWGHSESSSRTKIEQTLTNLNSRFVKMKL